MPAEPTRVCLWEPTRLSFWAGVEGVSVPVARLPIEVGPLGSYALLVGSPIRVELQAHADAWTRQGVLPTAALPDDALTLRRARGNS